MLIESTFSIFREKKVESPVKQKRRGFLHSLPLKFKFRKSKIFISILLPINVGIFVGFLSAFMGVGGGFVMVPAMIYIFRMGTVMAIGTSLFQIVFVTLNVSLLHATFNYSVDLILAIFLLIGGVIGAQYGSKFTSRFKGEQIRVLLAMIVLVVCIKMGLELVSEPLINSRIILSFFYLLVERPNAEILLFDLSEKDIEISKNKLNPDLTIFGFTDSKSSLVLKIKGPSQKVLLQKKKKILGMWSWSKTGEFIYPGLFHYYTNKDDDEIDFEVKKDLIILI